MHKHYTSKIEQNTEALQNGKEVTRSECFFLSTRQPENGSRKVSLGTTTGIHAKKENNGLSFGENSKKSRYKLLDTAKHLLSNERITFCLHSLPTGAKVLQDTKTGHAHLAGVARCGLGWVCPVCSTKIALGRRSELLEASTAAREKGLQAYFVTYTASHKKEDTLQDNFTDMKAALTSLKVSRAWRELKINSGMVGYVDAWEITFGNANGWHPHMHSVIFASPGLDVQKLEISIFELWEKSLAKLGLSASKEHGVKVARANDNIGEYLTKWNLETEMTGANFKEGKAKSYTPMGLLALYQAGNKQAGILFQEYAKATKGKSSLRFSRGLRDLLGLGQGSTDKELAEAEQGRTAETLATFSPALWKEIKRQGKSGVIGELLIVAGMGQGALDIWLGALFRMGIDLEGRVRKKNDLQN